MKTITVNGKKYKVNNHEYDHLNWLKIISIDDDRFDGCLINELPSRLLVDVPVQYHSTATFHVDRGYYDDPTSYEVRWYEKETDQQRLERFEKIAAHQDKLAKERAERRKMAEVDERALYERLKKKFEKKKAWQGHENGEI